MKLTGKAWKFGDGISTDHIAPGRLFHLRSNLPELAKHVLEDARADFAPNVKPGDFVVGGRNFGQGSSREHAPTIIKMAGVSAVLAKSVARIFYRNAINIGLAILECPEAVKGINAGDTVEVDFDSGTIVNLTTGSSWQSEPFPPFIQNMIASDGLINYMKREVCR